MAIAFTSMMCLSPGEIMSKRGLDGRWFVMTGMAPNKAHVYPTQYGNRIEKGTVIETRETVIDLLFGRTWETKVRSAQLKWQRYCDRMNEEIDRSEYLEARYKDIA